MDRNLGKTGPDGKGRNPSSRCLIWMRRVVAQDSPCDRNIMALISFDDLHSDADDRRPLMPVATAGGADPTVLQSLRIAHDRGWVAPIAVGNSKAICHVAGEIGM